MSKKSRLPFSGKKIKLLTYPRLTFSGGIRCGNCQKSEDESPLKVCNRCKIAYYCSRECQVKNYNQHKNDCKDLEENMSELKSVTESLANKTEPEKDFDYEHATKFSLNLKIATSQHSMAKSLQSSRILKQVQLTWTRALEHSKLKELTITVLTIKAALYLYDDNVILASGILNIALKFLLDKEEEITSDQTKGIIAQDWIQNLENKASNEVQKEFFSFQEEAGLEYDEFENIIHYVNAPEIVKKAPLPLLATLLAFQWKIKEKYGDKNFSTQRLQVNQVIKIIALRDPKILKFLADPVYTKEYKTIYKEAMAKGFPHYIEDVIGFRLLGPLFNSIPGAREYIIQYLFPGAEVVPENCTCDVF